MNEDDSEQIAGLLMQMGFSPTDDQREADIAMLLTCSVRSKPEEKAKSKLGELRMLKESKPGMIIGVCGCMAQKDGDALKKGRPYLDMVVGTACIQQIPDLIGQIDEKRRFVSALDLPRSACDPKVVPDRVRLTGRAIKSFVTVTYGCDNFCSYCVVPYVRGRERSRRLEDVVEEVRDLAGEGRKEVTLLGQNVNSFGLDVDEPADFADLLRAVGEVDSIERIRFTTSHPKDLSDRLIDAMRDCPKVCEHLHLPVQAGDDEVLRAMNRNYTIAHFKGRVAALQNAVGDIAITTDFLVGFPGETEEQFENTLRLAQEVRFDAAFMFAYNPIPNTKAAARAESLTKVEKNARLNRLIKQQNAITCEINQSQVGRVFEVLVEGVSPKDASRMTGLTRQNKTVNFPGGTELVGGLVNVRATEAHLYGFVGELTTTVGRAASES